MTESGGGGEGEGGGGSGLTAVLAVEHPDLALTETAARDRSATIHPVREAGTDAESGHHHVVVRSDSFERFDAALSADPTVADFDPVTAFEGGDSIASPTRIGRSCSRRRSRGRTASHSTSRTTGRAGR